MKATIHHTSGDFLIDFNEPIDISIHTSDSSSCSKAWYVDPIQITPVMTDKFTGSVALGGTVNFRDIFFNPHGNTTHTECVGHIAEEVFNLQESLTKYFFKAQLVTLTPSSFKGEASEFFKKEDLVITANDIKSVVQKDIDALIIRTLPNNLNKKSCQWSGTNWPYLLPECCELLAKLGIKHLLLDLPSVDRELDGGKMLAHRAFWQFPNNTRLDATITEMIFVPDTCEDGIYFLNLQPSSFVNDAAPCKPVLYTPK